MRENPTETLGFISYKTWRANLDTRRTSGMRGYEPTYRPPGTALPLTYTTLSDPGTYHTGMGERVQIQRPGSDLSHIKSFGDHT